MRVYPRVYGETSDISGLVVGDTGLSPRVRGNRVDRDREEQLAGSIPACTGKPEAIAVSPLIAAVYPRVYGETR